MYRVGAFLGQGRHSSVYQDILYSDQVLKCIGNLKEFHLLEKLSHPNIIKPLGYIVEDNIYYMILPKLQPVTVLPSLSQVKRLVNAFKYLSDLEIDHKDVCINNIMISDGELILIDFNDATKYVGKDTLLKKYKKDLAVSLLYWIIEIKTSGLDIDEYDELFLQGMEEHFDSYGDLGKYLYCLLCSLTYTD